MPDIQQIWDSVKTYVYLRNGTFRHGISLQSEGTEIKSPDFLLPIVRSIDDAWPFDIEPDPRSTGQLIELLRACRFIKSGRQRISIIRDVTKARNLGAYDTPEPIVSFIVSESLKELNCTGQKPPRILDPSCGAGYFMIEALTRLSEMYPGTDPVELLTQSLTGFDRDQVAIELTMRNLRWVLRECSESDIPDGVLHRTDSLDAFRKLPHGRESFDCVIGNPPYRFLSGRRSPVALLKNSGKDREASKLEKEIDALTKRFPDSSKGCRDYYKWFINRSIEFLRDGGVLGLVVPNTWIAYSKYHDIRKLLATHGTLLHVLDLGSHAFRRAYVPASVIIWRKGSTESTSFHFTRMDGPAWREFSRSAVEGTFHVEKHAATITHDYEFNFSGNERTYRLPADSPYVTRLSDLAVIHEGTHSIPAVPVDVKRKPDENFRYRVLIDKTMECLKPPEIGYIDRIKSRLQQPEFHSGERFLIRKTGDRIVVAPSPDTTPALAHQNVYVGKLKDDAGISFHALIGILSSELITDLYRQGSGGQHKRPLAQLRIHFLNEIPIVVPSGASTGSRDLSIKEAENISRKCEKGLIEPVRLDSMSEEVDNLIVKLHRAIETLTRSIVRKPAPGVKHLLDVLVYHLYGFHISKSKAGEEKTQ